MGGLRICGRRCSGSLKSGTIIIQGGQLTAGGGGEPLKFKYNSKRKANNMDEGGRIGRGRSAGCIKRLTIIIQGG